jgi:hypothetical protein
MLGFGMVLVASIFPWRRSAVASSGFGDAWTLHWSLLGVVSAAVGLAAAVAGRRHLIRPQLAAAIAATCAVLVLTGTLLGVTHPPTLSSVAGAIPWRFAIVGGVIALAGAGMTAMRTRRRFEGA